MKTKLLRTCVTLLTIMLIQAFSTETVKAQFDRKSIISSVSKIGERFVYYQHIDEPLKTRPRVAVENGVITVDSGNIVIKVNSGWIEFIGDNGFKLPPANSTFFSELNAVGKTKGYSALRYSDTVIQINCKSIEICSTQDKPGTESELYGLFKKHLGVTLRGLSEDLSGSLYGMWQIKRDSGVIFISSDPWADSFLMIQSMTDSRKPIQLTYQLRFEMNGQYVVENVLISKKPNENPVVEKCQWFDEDGTQHTIGKEPSALRRHFLKYLPDLPFDVQEMFTLSVINGIEKCGSKMLLKKNVAE